MTEKEYCPFCGKEMEPDDIEEYEEGDTLFCFECGITNDSPSFHQKKRENKEHFKEWQRENWGNEW